MLWLAVHLPRLSLEALAATLPAGQGQQPLALLLDQQVQAVNTAAAQAGVRPGQRRATALALLPGLQLGQADAARDAQALQAVWHSALAFTPAVTLEGHSVLLEVACCLRYFGGADALIDRLRQALAPLGHRLRIAAAPTAQGAALLARWRDGLDQGPQRHDLQALQRLLDDAPVWLLGPGRAHWEALQGMALRRLSDLLALPRAGLARRFGEALLDELDRARGTRPDPRTWLTAPERFDSRLELAWRADSSEQVLHAAALLLARLVAWARARQSRVAAFELLMQHERRHRADDTAPALTRLRVAMAEPALDPAHLQLLLRERLAQVQLPAPTLELRLHCHELAQQPAPNGELFPTRQSTQLGLTRLIERLCARLGEAQVQRLQAVADFRPELATRRLPALAPPAGPVPLAAWPAGRPVWLLPTPLLLSERQNRPLFEGRPLQLLAGPERIETGWWDGAPAQRDYFVAQDHDGSLLWLQHARVAGGGGGALGAAPASDESGEPARAAWFLAGRFG